MRRAGRWCATCANIFESPGQVPKARYILKGLGKQFGKEKVTRKFLYQFIPCGYGKQARMIAGMR
jgi:sulfur relay (sulfurtransferase) DsrC/TusE family protein